MDAAFFIFKSFIVTIVVLLVLQIKIGQYTLEDNLDHAVRSAGIIQPAQEFADGIARFTRNTWSSFVGGVDRTFSIDDRKPRINFERSRAYLKEKASQTNRDVQSKLRKEGILEYRELEEEIR